LAVIFFQTPQVFISFCIKKKKKIPMNHKLPCKALILAILLVKSYFSNAQFGFNTTGATPDNSAMVDIASNTKGLLIPRLTTTERIAIASPATGLLVYDSTLSAFYYYNGTAWVTLASSKIQDADANTKVETEQASNENFIRFTLNGTEYFKMNKATLEVNNSGKCVYIGNAAGASDPYGVMAGGVILINYENTGIGANALQGSRTGFFNTALGVKALQSSTTGSYNTAIGHSALNTTNGGFNVGLGYQAGLQSTGSNNLLLGNYAGYSETGSNKLHIANNPTSSLVYGDFATKTLTVNDYLESKYFKMTNGATNGYILQSDASGNGSWVASSTFADNLGNHTALQNINLGSNYLSNDGTSKGIQIGSAGDVTITGTTSDLLKIGTGSNLSSILALKTSNQNWELGNGNGYGTTFTINDVTNDLTPFRINNNSDDALMVLTGSNVNIGVSSVSAKLNITGTTSTTNFTLTNGANNGYILQSDASGNATWVNPTTLSTGSSQWTTSGNNIYKNNTANVGIGITTPTELLHISEGNAINSGTFGSSSTLTVNGAGTRSFFYPRKGAFRAGTVTGVQFDNANIGNYSFAVGYNSQATGAYSNSMGFNNVASGSYATAIGNGSTASNSGSLALGLGTTASGSWATALGLNTTAKSYGEVVIGQYNTSYTPSSTIAWNTSDRLFSIGNGTASGSTSDALTVLKSGNVGIGTSTPSVKLAVIGSTSTTNLAITSGATDGYILQSDASGNATWVSPTTLPVATQTLIKDSDANTKIEVEQSSNDDKVHFSLGGKEYYTMNKGTLEFNNTGGAIYIGYAAGQTDTYSSNTYNIGIGSNALQKVTAGSFTENIAIGFKAIQNLTTGIANVAIGNYAMNYGNGNYNTTIGYAAGNTANTTGSGSQNVCIGSTSGSVVSGSDNTFLGTNAGGNVISGNNNVYVGLSAGELVYSGSNNVFIGYEAGALASGTTSNKLYIENSNSNSPLIYGDFANDYVNINGKLGIGTATPSNYLDIQASSSATASVQSSTSTAYMKVVSPSANESGFSFATYASGSNTSRWLFGKSNTSESGSNAGSDFFINRYTDAGAYSGQPISISRANGTVTVGNGGASTTANTLKINGSMSVATTVQSGSYTLSGTDYCVIFTGSLGTFTLPTASSCTGRIYLIVNQGTVALTTSTYRTGSATTVTSVAIGASVQVISDGTEWRKIN
jgi:trimeric autotransporter adhesin